jgi:hypothetical protein
MTLGLPLIMFDFFRPKGKPATVHKAAGMSHEALVEGYALNVRAASTRWARDASTSGQPRVFSPQSG